MMFVSESHGFVTVCRGDNFLTSGSAAALDEVDRVLTAHFDTKILPRIGPTAYGCEVCEGQHLGRTVRWSRQGFEWESNMKLDLKGAPTPITKATGKGRRDDRPSLQFAMSAVISGRGDVAVQLPGGPGDAVCLHGHGLVSG